jgi:hypothetical protein
LGKILPIYHATTLQLSSVRLTWESRQLDRGKIAIGFLFIQPFYYHHHLYRPTNRSWSRNPLNGIVAKAKERRRKHPDCRVSLKAGNTESETLENFVSRAGRVSDAILFVPLERLEWSWLSRHSTPPMRFWSERQELVYRGGAFQKV